MAVRPYEGGRFEKIGSEESHTIESYERKVHGTPFSEPQRQYSQQQFTERRTYGRDENGEVVVKIEKNPSEPVRPVSPVRPVTPVGEHKNSHLLKPIQPLTIPRIDIHSISPSHSPRRDRERDRYQVPDDVSPRSVSYQLQASPRSARGSPRGEPISPRSNSSLSSNGIGMKKIIKKTRWVSIHDGRPVSPYTETVTYEPVFPDRYSSASGRSGRSGASAASLSPRPHQHQRENSSPRPSRRPSECAYLMENPLYRD